MRDTFSSANMHDFNGRYADTYGFLLSKDDSRRLVLFNECSDDFAYFQTEDGGLKYHAKRDAGARFEFIQVDHRFFNAADGHTYLVERRPARQWKRGISRQNTTLYQLSSTDGIRTEKMSLKLLNDIFADFSDAQYNPQINPSLAERETVALSRNFAIYQGKVYFYSIIVGDVEKDMLLINRKSLVRQEVDDAVNRNGWKGIYTVGETE